MDARDRKQSGHWLNAERVTVYPRIVLAIFVATSIAWILLSKRMIDPDGKPLGYDFITFYAASKLALAGHAADAYSLALIFGVEKLIVPASDKMFAWYYPPAFFLLAAPLALLPYFGGWVVFVGSTLAAYVAVFRRVVKAPGAMWLLAAFPGVWINLLHGQNAFLTAALAAAGLILLPRRPVVAGVFMGLLAVKPHLALLFPVALIAIGAWRALASAAVTAIAFTGLGTLVLGRASLRACLGSLRLARYLLESGGLSWSKMPTPFALLRILHAPVGVAYAAHAVLAVIAAGLVWRVWRGSADWQLRSAALMTATFFVSPYVFDYDLAWLAFPIAWLALIGLRDGWRAGDREILLAAWALPFLAAPVTNLIGVQPGPFVLGALLWAIVRRTRALSAKELGCLEETHPGSARVGHPVS